MIKAIVTTATAVLLTAFMLRDRTGHDSGTTVMVTILWLASAYLWWLVWRARGGSAQR